MDIGKDSQPHVQSNDEPFILLVGTVITKEYLL
jgi:hypothetical protein